MISYFPYQPFRTSRGLRFLHPPRFVLSRLCTVSSVSRRVWSSCSKYPQLFLRPSHLLLQERSSFPTSFRIASSLSVQEAGLLSMAYSFILQLLQFRPQNDGFRVDPAMLNGLGESMESWSVALALLSTLLKHTPMVRYCIVHGLNDVETGGAVQAKGRGCPHKPLTRGRRLI